MTLRYSPSHQLQMLARRADPARMQRLNARIAKPATRSPCPGCAQRPEYTHQYYPKGEFCDDCLASIWQAEDTIAAAALRQAAGGLERVQIPSRWPYLFAPRHDHAAHQAMNAIGAAVHAVVAALVVDRIEQVAGDNFGHRYRWVDHGRAHQDSGALFVAVPQGAGDALEALGPAITEALGLVYECGVAYGTGLLTRLAVGEITPQMFDGDRQPPERRR